MLNTTSKIKGKNSASPESKVCSNCCAPEGSGSVVKLSACARCGLVVYCGRDCQRTHLKANHKQYCIAKADREPRFDTRNDAVDSEAVYVENCVICQGVLSKALTSTLPCAHAFHSTGVAELRKFGMEQTCRLCRIPLPPGPEKIAEEATRRNMVLYQLVRRDRTTWSLLPAFAQKELDGAVSGWRAAADSTGAVQSGVYVL